MEVGVLERGVQGVRRGLRLVGRRGKADLIGEEFTEGRGLTPKTEINELKRRLSKDEVSVGTTQKRNRGNKKKERIEVPSYRHLGKGSGITATH